METLLFITFGVVLMVSAHMLARLATEKDMERAKRQGYGAASAMARHETNRQNY
jgi:hypothetical protein